MPSSLDILQGCYAHLGILEAIKKAVEHDRLPDLRRYVSVVVEFEVQLSICVSVLFLLRFTFLLTLLSVCKWILFFTEARS